jgi:hypothetical protein
MSTNKEIFEQFGEKIVPELREVSKRFADSVRYDATENSLIISGDKHIGVLVNGRPPTSSNPERGPKTLQQLILEWIPTKSIVPRADAKGRIPTVEQLSWMVSRSIHMKGDLLYQRGGQNNPFDPILTEDRINSMLSLIGDRYFASVNSINLGKIK